MGVAVAAIDGGPGRAKGRWRGTGSRVAAPCPAHLTCHSRGGVTDVSGQAGGRGRRGRYAGATEGRVASTGHTGVRGDVDAPAPGDTPAVGSGLGGGSTQWMVGWVFLDECAFSRGLAVRQAGSVEGCAGMGPRNMDGGRATSACRASFISALSPIVLLAARSRAFAPSSPRCVAARELRLVSTLSPRVDPPPTGQRSS